MRRLIFVLFIFCVFSPQQYAHASAVIVDPIRIMIVPGHDSTSWGAQYGNLKEADMNLELATRIFNILKKDSRFFVFVTREKNGYREPFASYFTDNKENIKTFITSAKKHMGERVESGDFEEKENAPHGTAPDEMVQKLYGFNKWADENEIDAMIHVHFNDYVRKTKWKMGDRKGFTIYVPDEEFLNSDSSLALANSLFDELSKKFKTSNYVNELGGMVYDQKLIAIGANNTLLSTVRSVLVEYGYVYEFPDRAKRLKAYDTMANLTVAGLQNYFFPQLGPFRD